MSEIPDDLLYTEEHEYLKPAGADGEFFVGITDYAQGELGDIVYLEFPKVGDTFDKMDTFGVIEAVKAVNDLYCPVGAEVVGVNRALEEDPSLVNSDPYGDGWMIRIRSSEEAEIESLMDAEEYALHLGE